MSYGPQVHKESDTTERLSKQASKSMLRWQRQSTNLSSSFPRDAYLITGLILRTLSNSNYFPKAPSPNIHHNRDKGFNL